MRWLMLVMLTVGCGMSEYEACEKSLIIACECGDETIILDGDDSDCEELGRVEDFCSENSRDEAADSNARCFHRKYRDTCDIEEAEAACE